MKWLDEIKHKREFAKSRDNIWIAGDGVLDRLIAIAELAENGGMTLEIGNNPAITTHRVCPICYGKEFHHGQIPDEYRAQYGLLDNEGNWGVCPYSDDWRPDDS